QGTLEELAEQFGVSEGWAKKISAIRTRTRRMDRPPWRRGPEPSDGCRARVDGETDPPATRLDLGGVAAAVASCEGPAVEHRAAVAGLAAKGAAAEKKSLHTRKQETR